MRRILGLLFSLVALWSVAGHTAELASVRQSHSTATLLLETVDAPKGRPFWVAVRLDPQQGWHTYWENPGDSGAAPLIDWSLPDGVTMEGPLYGTPGLLAAGPLMNYGYAGRSYLLFRAQLAPDFTASTLKLSASLEWLTCDIECVPQFGSVDAEISVGQGRVDEDVRSDFIAARGALPDPEIWSADLTVEQQNSVLTVHMSGAEMGVVARAHFFPLSEGVTRYAAEQRLSATDQGLTLTLDRQAGAQSVTDGRGILVLTYKDGSVQEVDLNASVLAPAPVAASDAGAAPGLAAEPVPLWQAAIFAFLGGIILNLMPCVFPVLSLKAFSIARSGGANQAETRREGLAYTFGIIASFAVIVAALVALRSGGAAIGWGFQLQEPLFVAAMALIMMLVAMSLAGVFEISIGMEGAGQSLASSGGTKGAFFTGVLATLVATPCTAPLMAPAIGFALSQSVGVIALVFLMLALGLAFPFLLLSFSPAVASLMPRPGPWMETFKQGLAFPMLATTVWLLSVFATQAGPANMILLLAALVIVAFGIWLFSKRGRISKIAGGVIAAVTVLVFVQQPLTSAPEQAPEGVQTASWSRDTVAALRAGDKPVFAYFTADWCITCKVNERVALYREETMALFEETGVTLVKGDWTNRNDEIAKLLSEYGRAGVPLYLYYPVGGDAILLPEILTPGIIKETLTSS